MKTTDKKALEDLGFVFKDTHWEKPISKTYYIRVTEPKTNKFTFQYCGSIEYSEEFDHISDLFSYIDDWTDYVWDTFERNLEGKNRNDLDRSF